MMDENTTGQSLEGFADCLQNRYLYEENSLTEAMTGFTRSLLRPGAFVAAGAVYLALLAAVIWFYFHGSRSETLLWEFGALTFSVMALLYYTFALWPRRSARLQLSRQRELYGSIPIEPCTIFTPDAVLGTNEQLSSDVLRLQYGSLKRVAVTKKLIVLCTASRQLLILDKARFENGTETDFWRLLKEKRPDLKLPKGWKT